MITTFNSMDKYLKQVTNQDNLPSLDTFVSFVEMIESSVLEDRKIKRIDPKVIEFETLCKLINLEFIIPIINENSAKLLFDCDISILEEYLIYQCEFDINEQYYYTYPETPIDFVTKYYSLKDLYDYYYWLLRDDVIENYTVLLKKRGIDAQPSKLNIREIFELIQAIPFTQMTWLSYKTAVYLADQIATNKYTLEHVSAIAFPTYIKNFRTYFLNHWNLSSAIPDFANKNTKNFIRLVMESNITILDRVLNFDDFKQIVYKIDGFEESK